MLMLRPMYSNNIFRLLITGIISFKPRGIQNTPTQVISRID